MIIINVNYGENNERGFQFHNNFQNLFSFAFPNKDRILSKGLNKTFRRKSVR